MNEIMWEMEENNEKDRKKTVIKIWENNGIKFWKMESNISQIFCLIPINFLSMSLTTEINNLDILLTILVTGEKDSPSTTSGLRYFSTR